MKLGQKAIDVVTGFEGIIVGLVQYLTGCNQVLLSPPVKDNKSEPGYWFDETRIKVIDSNVIQLPGNKIGEIKATTKDIGGPAPSR